MPSELGTVFERLGTSEELASNTIFAGTREVKARNIPILHNPYVPEKLIPRMPKFGGSFA